MLSKSEASLSSRMRYCCKCIDRVCQHSKSFKLGSRAEHVDLRLQVCSNHKDIAHALEVWKHPPVCPHDPESAFRSRGGGRGKLESFFVAPKARTSEAMITNETTQPADPSTAPKQGTGNLEPPSVGPQGYSNLPPLNNPYNHG
jgi:hypothetical protein